MQHRWAALALFDRWIGKYLPSQIVFLLSSSFHSSTHRLPLYTHGCHFSGFFYPSGLAFILSQEALTGICCANTLAYTWIYDEEDSFVCKKPHSLTPAVVRLSEGLHKQRVDKNCPQDNGLFYEAWFSLLRQTGASCVLIWILISRL